MKRLLVVGARVRRVRFPDEVGSVHPPKQVLRFEFTLAKVATTGPLARGSPDCGYMVTVTQEIGGEMQYFEGGVVGFDEMTNSYQVEFEIQVRTLVFNQNADLTPLEIQKMGLQSSRSLLK